MRQGSLIQPLGNERGGKRGDGRRKRGWGERVVVKPCKSERERGGGGSKPCTNQRKREREREREREL